MPLALLRANLAFAGFDEQECGWVIEYEQAIPYPYRHELAGAVLSHADQPEHSLVLLSIGLLAISVEIYHPGATVPAIVGVICLVLAFVALGNLPVNWGGVILIVAAVILFIVDVKVNSVALTVGGSWRCARWVPAL